MQLANLPFHIGVTEKPWNPAGLPNTWPLSLHFDARRGTLAQQLTPELIGILDRAYRTGHLIGTPLAEDSYGRPYADDFLRFVKQARIPRGARAMEIGAGVGYLTRRLNEAGWRTTGIEPGRGYAAYWDQYGVDIIDDFFPTPRVTGRFELICSYAVLEHIIEPTRFLTDIRDHLSPEGVALFSVPDCTEEIIAGDPAILFHEHINYFDAGSLARLIESIGMHAVVTKSGFGRCLYALASPTIKRIMAPGTSGLDYQVLESFPERCIRFIERVRGTIAAFAAQGTVGVYCAARGLALLDQATPMRFFDDDPALQGRFLPPFQEPIMSRADLLSTPVDYLVIMSRTFGHRIRESLRYKGYRGRILTLDQMCT